MELTYFFDTYALFEVFHENKNYLIYTKNISMIMTKLNLMELHYSILRLYGEEKAEKAFNFFNKFCIEFDDEVIKEANAFRLKKYKRELSYVDCIGYILAKKFNARFLTGDEQIKDFENVEFVK